MSAKSTPSPKGKRKTATKAVARTNKPGPKPAVEPAGYTIARWCQLAGFDRHTLASRISEMKIEAVGKSAGQAADLYSIRDLVRAILGGDIEAEKLRKTREEADKLALANARSRGELVEIASVKKLGEKIMVAIRNRLLNMPLTDEEKDRCLTELMDLGKLDWSREG
jgi:hypothetical protein